MNPKSAKVSWLEATGSWFRNDYDLLGRAFSVVVALRCALALHTIVSNIWLGTLAGADVVVLVVASLVLCGWTLLVSWRLRRPSSRTLGTYVADVAVTTALVVVTPLVAEGDVLPYSLAGIWLCGCSIYIAVLASTRWGALSVVVTGAALMLIEPGFTLQRLNVVIASLLGTIMLGLLMGQFKASITEQERERIRSVALAERERLSRIVHDGALQVLALVEREGPQLGPRGIRLAALARESESQLRNLLRDREIVDEDETSLVDLAAALDKYQSAKVTVSTMAGQVIVPRLVVDEVEATLVEALKNVEKHAGAEAQAWVLLDQEADDEVILWVRDNGVGMSSDEVTEASIRGRMGIKDSIVGRMSALGGSAMLKSSPGLGTEWELRFPVDMGEL